MALELMRDEMLRQLKARSATEFQISEYVNDWNIGIEQMGKPLPCPSCYLRGDIRRLKSISDENGVGIARCEHCREKFTYQNQETR